MHYLNDSDEWVRGAILRRQLDTWPVYRRRKRRPYRFRELLPLPVISPLLDDQSAHIRELASKVVERMTELRGEVL